MFSHPITRIAAASIVALVLSACGETAPCMGALDMTCSGNFLASTPQVANGDDDLLFSHAGVHLVGFETVSVERDGTEPLTIKIWYPAGAGAEMANVEYPVDLKSPEWRDLVDEPTVLGRAAVGAPVAAGPHPAVVLSHGYALNAEWYADLSEHFASRGYVVFAAEHAEQDWLAAFDAAFERPLDVRTTLDFVESLTDSEGDWAGAVDMDRIAVVGHSFGGCTALAAAGAQLDPRAIDAHCGDLDETDPRAFLCAPFVGRAAEVATRKGLDAGSDALWPSMKDDRIAAIIPISADAWVFGSEGLAAVDVPTMAIGGTADVAAPWAWSNAPIFDHVSSDLRASVGLRGGGHFLAMNVCVDLPWVEAIPDLYDAACFDAAWDRREGLRIVKHYATAFLDTVFEDDSVARAALIAPAPDEVRVAVEAR